MSESIVLEKNYSTGIKMTWGSQEMINTMMNSLAPKHQLWISVCTEKNMKKTHNTEWTLNQNMYYTEKIFREKQYTSRKYSFHEMKLVIFFNYDEYRMIGKTKHAWQSMDHQMHVLKMYHERQEYSTEKVL